MRQRRLACGMLLFAVLAGGFLWRDEVAPMGGETVPKPIVDAHEEVRAAGAPVRIVEFLTPERPAVAVGAEPVQLNGESAAVMSEAITLQLLAGGTELELAARQWSALAAVTLKYQAIRQAYEATLAKAAQVGPGQFRIEIPVYAAAGDALRAKFQAELREQLGGGNAAEVLAQLGAKLEGHFGGFGVSVQTLELRADAAADGFAVTRTVQFWNSVDGGPRITTRRETHYPAQEDREGWRPLLALVGGE